MKPEIFNGKVITSIDEQLYLDGKLITDIFKRYSGKRIQVIIEEIFEV